MISLTTEEFITIASDIVKIRMQMDGQSFAKARLMQFLTSAGYTARKDAVSGTWLFEPYLFTETDEQDEMLCVTGKGFDGTSLYNILTDSGIAYEKKAEIIDELQNIASAAGKQEVQLPMSGPACTAVGKNGTYLFLPEDFFERALKKHSDKAYSQFLGCWINGAYSGKNAMHYTLSVYAYCAACGKLPFDNLKSEERHEDWFDKNFIPCEFAAIRSDRQKAKIITSNLTASKYRGGKNSEAPAELQDIPSMKEFFVSEQPVSDEEVQLRQAEAVKTAKKQQKNIAVKRFLRKKHVAVKAAAFAAAVALLVVVTTVSGNSAKVTTKGISSLDTVKTFYKAMNVQDVELLTRTLAKNEGKYYVEMISGFYITGKMRAMYESEAGTVTPEQWFWFKNDSDYWMFGITGLKINDELIDPQVTYFTIKDKPQPVTEENGKKLSSGDKQQYTAQYYLVRTEGISKITVSLHTDSITLTYKQTKWIISDISGTYENVPVNSSEFFIDFTDYVSADLKVPAITEALRSKYPWIPGEQSVIRGETELREKFTSKYIVK